MNRRIAAGLLAAAALVTAGCQNDPQGGGGDNQRAAVPDESTPAPDATVGVDAGLVEYYTQTLRWEDCDEEFQCATARVPLDYDDPAGAEIELALLRAPATEDDPLGSLLVNPGGPGASGVEYAQLAGSVVTDRVRERYDVVGFDPRGVGESVPIDCVDDQQLDEQLASDPSPDDEDEIAELQDLAQEFAAGCESRSADLLPHLSTRDVARDLDVLRAALGDRKLNFLGKSYGSRIGAIYAELFPDRAGRLVLDGAMDTTLTGHEVALGQVQGFERALSAFLAWCLDQDECAAGSSEDEARDAIEGLLREADEDPLPTDDENRPLTESLAFYGLVLPLYLTPEEGYPPLNDALDDALHNDDGSMLMSFADIYLKRSSDGGYNGNQNEAIVVVNCLDFAETPTVEQVEANLPRFEQASPIFGPLMAWGGLGCAELPVDPAGRLTSITAQGADPIVVVGTTGDPATPYEWAQSLAQQLSSGVLVTYEAAVHTAYLAGSSCVDRAVDTYFLDGTVPEDGLSCGS